MASIREMETKTGGICYEVGVSRGRGKSKVYRRFYPEAGWSKRTIDRELNKFVRDLEKEVEAGETVSREERKEKELEAMREAAKVQTLKQYGEKVFMPTKKVTISENTRSSFQGCLDRRIYPALGDLRLPDITSANISAFLLSVQAEGKSHGTVIKYYTILKSLFKMAYMNDEIPRNPMDKVERPKPRKDEARKMEVEAYTEEETAYILECLEKEPLKWRVLMELMIDTGIRRGECCGLKWSNVDFQSNTITIEHNLCYTPEKGVYLDTPKNGKAWTTDAFYRETAAKVASRRRMGAICVEMECASMQAMCRFRGVEFFQFFYAGDNLDHSSWDPRSLSGHVRLADKEKIGLLAFELACRIN